MQPQLTTLVQQTRTHVSRHQSQHRPTASERTEPRRSHAAFYCYSVKRLLTVMCGWQITSH